MTVPPLLLLLLLLLGGKQTLFMLDHVRRQGREGTRAHYSSLRRTRLWLSTPAGDESVSLGLASLYM